MVRYEWGDAQSRRETHQGRFDEPSAVESCALKADARRCVPTGELRTFTTGTPEKRKIPCHSGQDHFPASDAQHFSKRCARDPNLQNFGLDLGTKWLSLDIMAIDHHPLITEFPEHRETLHSLKLENAHFQKLMESYELVDKEVVRMEEGIETPEDAVLTELKKQRLELKDQIAGMLRAAEA